MSTAASSPEPQENTSACDAGDRIVSASSSPITGELHKQHEGDSASQSGKKPRLVIQRTHAAFVSKLYAMVSDSKTDQLISWTADGDSFQVMDPIELSQEILPLYFKHGNWQSFVRQLNMYGFHKVNDLEYGGVFGDTQLWMFKHLHFLRGQPKRLQMIKRRGPGSTKPSGPHEASEHSTPRVAASPATPTGTSLAPIAVQPAAQPATPAAPDLMSTFERLNSRIYQLEESIYNMQRANRALYDENQDLRTAHMKTQDAFAGLLRFLESTVVKPSMQGQSSETAERFQQLTEATAPLMASRYLGPPPLAFSTPMAAPPAVQEAKVPPTASFRPEVRRHEGLPYILPKRTPQQAPFQLRVPSLSPPTPLSAMSRSRDAVLVRKRRSNSSSSNMSASSSSEAGDNPTPSPDSLLANTPPGAQTLPSMRVVLPPISGMMEGAKCNGQQRQQPQVQPLRSHQAVVPILPAPASLQSLRETLAHSSPAKRRRAD